VPTCAQKQCVLAESHCQRLPQALSWKPMSTSASILEQDANE